ncbi:transcription termination factor 3, mitochondrial-like [Asterias rubens]|uniref:transcription termination factor 3, mitochondrial-like n=1 Tax=Asterias rubens TaxID=7604 RepID=UPI0014551F7D|nr:transcription termination factor 3, mitochondrial-like [Asterias rubens]
MSHYKTIAMATKMFPKSFAYYQSLNSKTNLAVCRTNTIRCLSTLSQQRWRKAAGGINDCLSKKYFEGTVGLSAASPKTDATGWHQILQSPWRLSKTWLSTGSSFVICAPRDEHGNGDRPSTSVSGILHTDTSGVAKTDSKEINALDDDVLKTETRNSDSVTVSIDTENIYPASRTGTTSREPTKVNSDLINAREDGGIGLLDDADEDDVLAAQDSPMVLEEFIKPFLPTESLTLASYADHSVTIQKLVELGVDLSKVEKKARIGNALLKMDFEKDIKDKIIFLHDVGISGEGLGRFLTINPFVLTEELQSLEARIGYLRGKKFSEDAITRVLTRAPFFISFSVERVDSKLGFYQKELSLTGNELRSVITKMPKLVTFKVQHIKESLFVIRQQLGFTRSELKNLILEDPRVLLRGKKKLISTFDVLHNHMGIPHKQLVKNPQVFNGRVYKLQERHQFLKLLGLAQYDPTKPGYISTENLSKVPDAAFAQEIAKSSINEYNTFLKTL